MEEFAINKLKQLLLKQEFEERKTGQKIYVKKTQAYKDLIKLLEDCMKLEETNQLT